MAILSKSRWVACDGALYCFRTPEEAQKFIIYLKELKPAPVKVRRSGRGTKSAHYNSVK